MKLKREADFERVPGCDIASLRIIGGQIAACIGESIDSNQYAKLPENPWCPSYPSEITRGIAVLRKTGSTRRDG